MPHEPVWLCADLRRVAQRLKQTGTIQSNHECTRIDTNETAFVLPDPNEPHNGEPGAFSANLFHFPAIRVHSCLFVVSDCMTPDKGTP